MGAAARDLSGRRVLVTGASSGIGAATCRAVVDRGGTVAMLARRKERLENLAEELGPTRDPCVLRRHGPQLTRGKCERSRRSSRRIGRGRRGGGSDDGRRDHLRNPRAMARACST